MRDRKREAVEYRKAGWAVRPEVLEVIAGWVRGEVADEEIAARAGLSALGSSSVRIAGGVAVIPLRGLITPTPSLISLIFGLGTGGLQGFRSSLREALASSDVSAILIDVDSPGGLTDLVPETAAEIRDARGQKPIVAVANTTAASAAYWIASAADEVVVTPSGQVGSIGVFALHTEFSKMDERVGMTSTLIRAGKFKAEANEFEPLTDEARAAIQETVDAYYSMFVGDVAAGRGVDEASVRGGFGEGRMVLASQAVELGMADRVETFEDAVARLAATAVAPAGDGASGRLAHQPQSASTEETADETDSDGTEVQAAEPEQVDEAPKTSGLSSEDRRRLVDVLTG